MPHAPHDPAHRHVPTDLHAAPHVPISVEEMAHAFEDDDAHAVDLSIYAVEDWVTMALFWLMGLCVFLQFFTRYALNNSLAWTEEIAANCLVVIVFLGSVMCVRLGRHIAVDLLYRYVSPRTRRVLEIAVDVLSIAFYAYTSWLMWRYIAIVGSERMVTVKLPRGIVFYTVFAAFVLMFLRAVQRFVHDLRAGRSVREAADDLGPTGV